MLPVSSACTPPSGSLFDVGTTTVTCTAADAAARQAQCAFGVTVSPFVLSISKFVAVGDSVTEGQNGRAGLNGRRIVDVPNAYPTKLQFLLNAEYPAQQIVVANRGVGGQSVQQGLENLPQVLAAEHGDAVLLLHGYNNLLNQCRPKDAGSPACAREIDLVVATLRECIHVARTPAFGIKYVFVSTFTPPGPFVGSTDRRIAAEAIVQANTRLSQAVTAEGAILVDPYPSFAGRESAFVDEDGLHLRPAGQQAVAETFFTAIKTSVSTSLAGRPF
jgi:lysophospholipase L1-like esterase